MVVVNLELILKRLKSHPSIKTKVRIAQLCEVSPQALDGWTRIPAEYVLRLEAACDGEVSRFEMRPDVFGLEPDRAKDGAVA